MLLGIYLGVALIVFIVCFLSEIANLKKSPTTTLLDSILIGLFWPFLAFL